MMLPCGSKHVGIILLPIALRPLEFGLGFVGIISVIKYKYLRYNNVHFFLVECCEFGDFYITYLIETRTVCMQSGR